MAEVVSSLEDHLGWKRGKSPQVMEEPDPSMSGPQGAKSQEGDTSMEKSLAKARETHQRALPTAAILEEELDHLSHPVTRGWLEA